MMRNIELSFNNAYDPISKKLIDVTTDTVSVTANIERSLVFWKVPRGARWVIPPVLSDIVIKLKDTANNELSPLTEIAIGFKGPNEREQIFKVTFTLYRKYRDLTIQQQRSSDYNTALVFPSDLPLELVEDDELHLLIKSPVDVTLSFANSILAFTIEEHSYHK